MNIELVLCHEALPAEPAEWCKVATEGEWTFPNGTRKRLSFEHFAAAADLFAETHGGGKADGLIDYEHATLAVADGKLNPKDLDAAGWFSELELRGDHGRAELWIRPDWTQAASEKIARREKRYLSPVLMFGVPHPRTGEATLCKLHSVALTVAPFFTHLPAVAANDLSMVDLHPHTAPSAFRGFALDHLASGAEPFVGSPPYPNEHALSVAAPPEGAECRTKELTPGISIIICKEADTWHEASYRFDADKFSAERARAWLAEHGIEGEFHTARVKGHDMDLVTIANHLGMTTNEASEDAVLAKLDELVAASDPPAVPIEIVEALSLDEGAALDDTLLALNALKGSTTISEFDYVAIANSLGLESSAKLDEIIAAICELKGSVITTAAEQLVASAIADGKIPPADKQHWLTEAKRDAARVETLIGAMTPLIARRSAQPPPDDDDKLTPEDRLVAQQMGVDPKELQEANTA
jgi:phage I-like protein